ncbi:AhpD-like protein [Fusarium flagelliforme]|uniref:AhpD-like protein n=1 Tax=Fusarium flagelliforme TaxID=2675880 RepID=UPI001E8EA537|nr:AhpD-like protein [Fusarium flagelliforme]KAH7198683.1 AhpD-like protein [Fusarium flagelliforme]
MAALTPILTPALLATIRKQPNLPRNTWYFITATTLSALNRPDELPKVLRSAIEEGPSADGSGVPSRDEQLRISRRLREALLKASAVGGMPKTINALLSLKSATPEDLLDEAATDAASPRHKDIYDTQPTQVLQRGQSFFESIYGKISKRIMGQMERSGAPDLGLLARLTYGYVLSNTDVLTAAETSFVLIASLIPQDVNPQLKGHLRGALNGGASEDEVRAVRDIVIKICEASGMKRLEENATGGWGWRSEVANI